IRHGFLCRGKLGGRLRRDLLGLRGCRGQVLVVFRFVRCVSDLISRFLQCLRQHFLRGGLRSRGVKGGVGLFRGSLRFRQRVICSFRGGGSVGHSLLSSGQIGGCLVSGCFG